MLDTISKEVATMVGVAVAGTVFGFVTGCLIGRRSAKKNADQLIKNAIRNAGGSGNSDGGKTAEEEADVKNATGTSKGKGKTGEQTASAVVQSNAAAQLSIEEKQARDDQDPSWAGMQAYDDEDLDPIDLALREEFRRIYPTETQVSASAH